MFTLKSLFYLYTLAVTILAHDSRENPENGQNKSVVKTKYGFVRGFQYDLGRRDGQKADIFLGIPYAKPPIGELRFEKPVEVESWTCIKDATAWGSTCSPDSLSTGAGDSEDCLTLNIFRPSKGRSSPRTPRGGYPVLVWIHGGGYVIGNEIAFGYTNLSINFVPQGIIVVTIQYRLGPFGWASLGDGNMPGNLGYWDMTQAFKFLNQTIRQFGGNPKKMTVWGLSSGSAAAAAIAVSPHSRDFVVGSIEQSGEGLSSWGANDDVVTATFEFVNYLNCSNSNNALVKACLKATSKSAIFAALQKNATSMTRFDNINIVKYQPRIDGDFFPKNMSELYKETAPLPSIQGINTHEAIFYSLFGFQFSIYTPMGIPKADWPTFLEANFSAFVRQNVIDEDFYGPQASAAADDVISFYTANKPDDYATNYAYWITQYTQLISDVMFDIPLLWTADAKRNAGWPTYMYLDEHYNPALFNNTFITDPPVQGTFHTNEYPYQFGAFVFAEFDFDEQEKKMQNVLISTIGNFVKNGNPSTPRIHWPKLSATKPYSYLSIQPNPVFNTLPLMNDRLQFWNNVTAKYPFNIILRTKNA